MRKCGQKLFQRNENLFFIRFMHERKFLQLCLREGYSQSNIFAGPKRGRPTAWFSIFYVRSFVRTFVQSFVRTYVSLDQNILTTHSLTLDPPNFN